MRKKGAGMAELYDNWFPQRRFGMFIHWGLYAIPGWHEQHMGRLGIPRSEYEQLIHRFNPRRFNPDAWLDVAEAAGMRYVCFTTKHHDGFCMWNTSATDFQVMRTPYGRDVLALLAEACHRRGIGLSLYYSNPDWHHPNAYNPRSTHQVDPAEGDQPDQAAYIAYITAQVRELCTNYGKIISFFWDIPPRFEEHSLNQLVRQLQPGIMINDRGHAPGDYSTPERHVPAGLRFEQPTEACQSVGRQSWGYRSNEDYYSTRVLTASIDKIMAMGGNYLLNVGPKADGTLPPRAVQSIRRVGAWYQRVRESFELAEPASQLIGRDDLLLTRRGNTLYVHCGSGPEASGIALNPLVTLPARATVLNTGRPVKAAIDQLPTHFSGWAQRLPIQPCLHLYDIPVDAISSEAIVLKLEFDDLPAALRAAGAPQALAESRA
jgi:alpha-L-fucosidase